MTARKLLGLLTALALGLPVQAQPAPSWPPPAQPGWQPVQPSPPAPPAPQPNWPPPSGPQPHWKPPPAGPPAPQPGWPPPPAVPPAPQPGWPPPPAVPPAPQPNWQPVPVAPANPPGWQPPIAAVPQPGVATPAPNAPLPAPVPVPPGATAAPQQTYVGEIHIIGNIYTRDDVIRAQIPLYPGHVLSYPDLRRAEENLRRLNIFEVNQQLGIRPTVEVIDPYGPSQFKDLLVTVQETNTLSFRAGVGVNSDAGVSGGINIHERNFDITGFPGSWDDVLAGRAFRGGGQQFTLNLVPGNETQDYSATWRDPFFLNSRASLGVSGYYRTRHYLEYDDTRLGTHISVGRHFGDYWSFNSRIRAEQVGVDNVQPFAPPDYLDVVGDHFIVGFRPGIAYDDRDSWVRPTQGQRVDLSFEHVVGDFEYTQLRAGGSKYFTVAQRADGSGRHVLSLRSEIGWGNDVPVFDRFFAGGLHTIRGFSFRGVGPQENGLMVGGDFLFLNSIEYQFPVVANDNLYLVAFVDSGTVERDVEITTYRVAAGVGLRVVIPFMGNAPLGFDFAFPIVKDDQDIEQFFSFQVGFTR